MLRTRESQHRQTADEGIRRRGMRTVDQRVYKEVSCSMAHQVLRFTHSGGPDKPITPHSKHLSFIAEASANRISLRMEQRRHVLDDGKATGRELQMLRLALPSAKIASPSEPGTAVQMRTAVDEG